MICILYAPPEIYTLYRDIKPATGEEVTADVNSTATDDEGRFNPIGSLQFDIVGHESTSMKLKHNKRIGTCNVRSLYAGKLKVVTAEAKICKLDIVGLGEHRWAGQGHFTPDDGGKLFVLRDS